MIQLLSIGNSFSQDAQRYLHDIARKNGETIETVNLYIGGCSLEQHFTNMQENLRKYSLEMDGHDKGGFKVSIQEALLAREWDYITIQQASHFSYRYETYEPYLSSLAAYIRQLAPQAKLLIHETWAYESHSPRIRGYGFETYEEMFSKVEESYLKAAATVHADGIVPCGRVFLQAQKEFAKIHRDTFHASFGLGRLMLATTFYGYLTGKDVKEISFDMLDEPISREDYQKALSIVDDVLTNQNQ